MPANVTAALLDQTGTELRRVEVATDNGSVPQWLRIPEANGETDVRELATYLRQSSSPAHLVVYIWQFSDGIDSGKRIRTNPIVTTL